MRHFAALIGCFLVVSLSNAALVQRRTYRNTEEILVPVAIIQDGEEINKPADVKENVIGAQLNNLQPTVIAEEIAAAVDTEQKLEAVEAAVEAERRIDEAIVEEEIKEAVQEEQKMEIIQDLKEENKLSEIPEIISVLQPENSEASRDPAKDEEHQNEKLLLAETPASNNAASVADIGSESVNNAAQQPAGTVRQATQASPAQTTAQPNVVQQFIQNSPLGQLFNSQNGSASSPFPTFPSLPTLPTFDPVAAATQALQGFQQFTTNLGNQFQNPFASLTGQQQDAAVNTPTTARPPGPIQQFVNSFSQQPSQSAPAQPGPLQNFLNLFQGNRPQESTTTSPQPAKEPEIVDQTPEESAAAAAAAATSAEQVSNELRGSGETIDSFEESVQPNELIIINDDASETENDQVQEAAIVSN